MSRQIVMGLDATELPDFTSIEDDNGIVYLTRYGAWAKEADLPKEVVAKKYLPQFNKNVQKYLENDYFLRKYDTPTPRGRGRPRKEGSKRRRKERNVNNE